MSREGFIYVMTNKSMPGLVKIGMTTRDPEIRASDSDMYSTGVPTPFKVAYYADFNDMKRAEALVHRKLKSVRENVSREFFRIDVPEAIAAIESIKVPFKRPHQPENWQIKFTPKIEVELTQKVDAEPTKKIESNKNGWFSGFLFFIYDMIRFLCVVAPLFMLYWYVAIFGTMKLAQLCTYLIGFIYPPVDLPHTEFETTTLVLWWLLAASFCIRSDLMLAVLVKFLDIGNTCIRFLISLTKLVQ